MAYRLRDRSTTPGDYNFIAYRLAFLPGADEVKLDVDRGDSVLGTYDPGGVGGYSDPGVANVWNGVTYDYEGSTLTGTKRASSITNCEAGNIKDGITIDDVLGTYSSASGAFVSTSDGFYSKMALTANRLLQGKGQGVTLTHIVQGEYDPATGGVANTETTQYGTGAVVAWNNNQVDGSIIKSTDKLLLLSPINTDGAFLTAPVLNDKITDAAGTTYTMVEPFSRVAPAGTVVLYKINLRA